MPNSILLLCDVSTVKSRKKVQQYIIMLCPHGQALPGGHKGLPVKGHILVGKPLNCPCPQLLEGTSNEQSFDVGMEHHHCQTHNVTCDHYDSLTVSYCHATGELKSYLEIIVFFGITISTPSTYWSQKDTVTLTDLYKRHEYLKDVTRTGIATLFIF